MASWRLYQISHQKGRTQVTSGRDLQKEKHDPRKREGKVEVKGKIKIKREIKRKIKIKIKSREAENVSRASLERINEETILKTVAREEGVKAEAGVEEKN